MRLYLCEKPSQGKDTAAVLGAKTRGDGCIKGNGVAVTWGSDTFWKQLLPMPMEST